MLVKTIYNLYGVESLNLSEVASELSRLLNVNFSRRESSYKGGEYFVSDSNLKGKVSVENNWIDEDGYLSEPGYAKCAVLVYVNGVSPEVLDIISVSGLFRLLRSEEI
ncbi:hypothetical protein ACFFHI_12905 [Streptomyces palmae]|uniref:hypothetical protein n=1 Tax=Streptomyces palmae TaxID=1701085 RepID=UPI0035EEE367